MADLPGDHPAVVGPQKVLSNSALLLAPGSKVKSPVVGAPPKPKPAKKPLTLIEQVREMMKKVFPKGNMKGVKIEEYFKNTNSYIGNFHDLGAWTNSDSLIYFREDFPKVFWPYILKHESEHIIQFKGSSSSHPKSYKEMVAFEKGAYPKTEAWMNDTSKDGGPAVYRSLGLGGKIDFIKNVAKAASLMAMRLDQNVQNKVIEKFEYDSNETPPKLIIHVQAVSHPNKSEEDLYLENMQLNAFLPLGTYTIKELYEQP